MELEDRIELLLTSEEYPDLGPNGLWERVQYDISTLRTPLSGLAGMVGLGLLAWLQYPDSYRFEAGNGYLAGLAASQNLQQERQNAIRRTSVGDVFSRPGLVSIVGGLVGAGYAVSNTAGDALEVGHRAGWMGIASAALTYGLTSLIGLIVHPDSLKGWTDGGGNMESLLALPQSSLTRARLHTRIAQDLPDNQAVEHYLAAMHHMSQDEHRGISHFAIESATGGLAFIENPATTRQLLHNAMFNTLHGYFSNAEQFLHAAIRSAPHLRYPHLAHAKFLSSMATVYTDRSEHLEGKAGEELKIYAELLQRDESVQWRRIGECRNEVLIAEPHKDPANFTLSKSSEDSDTLREEERFTQFMYDQFERTDRPVAYVEGERDVLIFERAPGISLLELVKQGKHHPRLFIESARRLARMHAIPQEAFQKAGLTLEKPGEAFYSQRLESGFVEPVGMKGELRAAILEHAPIMDKEILADYLAPYFDRNLRNTNFEWREEDYDWERPRFMPRGYDLINKLDFHLDYLGPHRPKAIDAYVDEMEHLQGFALSLVGRQEFDRQLIIVGAQRHLELVGYRIRDADHPDESIRIDNEKAQRYHYERALDHFDQAAAIDGGDVQHPFRILHGALLDLDSRFTQLPHTPTYPRGFKHRIVGPAVDLAYSAAGVTGFFGLYWALGQLSART